MDAELMQILEFCEPNSLKRDKLFEIFDGKLLELI